MPASIFSETELARLASFPEEIPGDDLIRAFPCSRSYLSAHFERRSLLRLNPAARAHLLPVRLLILGPIQRSWHTMTREPRPSPTAR